MNARPLEGKKIAVLVESQYIPAEIKIYQERFSSYGAIVHLMSRLWGEPKLTFVSEVEKIGERPETLDVSVDFEHVNLEDYAAIIAAANYTTVRLRYNEKPITATNAAEIARSAPAVRFFRRAMQNQKIIKAAPCHALWLLTPNPDILAGRRVICNPVLVADVINAGALYTACPSGTPAKMQVVVDGDLVTTPSWEATETLVDTIKNLIINPPVKPEPAVPIVPVLPRKRRILILLSEWGYWGEELVGPLGEFDRAGYTVDFITPTGKRPNAITVSMDPDYFDPPLHRPVTTPEMAASVREIDDLSTEQGKRLENPINLSLWFPERPYFAAPSFVHRLEAYNRELERAARDIQKYDALLIVGGSGPIVDLANNQRVHDLLISFMMADKPIAAECYGIACFAFARDVNERKSILWGKHVTGHCLEYDYKDGTGFMKARGQFLDFNMGPPPYPLEFILRDATGPEGGFHGNFGKETSVIVDYPFITGRSTPDSTLTGKKLIEVLDGTPPLRRWGW
jgi:putative intracellular protease/amidase